MNKIALSIYIPTYNRAELLKYLLDSIVQDLTQWPSDLELIISDNASMENTKEIVISFIKRGFPITYLVNETNIGPEENITSAFNMISGKYMWVIGDDEIIYRGVIPYVLALCRIKEFGLLHLANHGFSHGQQEIVSIRKIPKKVSVSQLNSQDLFKTANIFLTFISANIINRQAILTTCPNFNAKADMNTQLPQLAWTYTALKVSNIHYYIQTPLFAALGDNTSGYKLIEVFGINLTQITKKYLEKTIPNAERVISNAVITRLLPRQLMRQFNNSTKKNQFLDDDIAAATRSCFQDKLLFKIFLKPILSTSSFQRKIAFFFVRVFNTVNRKLGYKLL